MKLKLIFCFLLLSAVLFSAFRTPIKKHPSTKNHYKTSLRVYADETVTNFFKRSQGWIASDGAITVPLNDGGSLWLMGDSHFNDYDPRTGTVPCLFQVRNCALLQPKGDWNWMHTTTFIGNGPGSRSFFKFNPSDTYFSWPGAGMQIGDTIYVYCSNLKKKDNSTFGWTSGGTPMWAKIKYPEMEIKGYSPIQDLGDMDFGFGVVKDEKAGYVYTYGCKLSGIEGKIYVARFPVNNISARWEFWDGKHWNADITKMAIIATAPSNSVSICKVKNRYLLFTAEFSVSCDQGKRIFVASANSVTGPFLAQKAIYSIPDRKDGHSPFFYGAYPHPEDINNKDELLVTYDINGYDKCATDCVNGRSDPNIYRPRGIRVPLKLIDPAL